MAQNPPLRAKLLFGYGRFLSFFKRPEKALAVFQAVTREAPGHRKAWSCVGFLLAGRDQLPAAIEAFRHALALNDKDGPAHFNVAFILQRTGRHDEAIEEFQRTIDTDPSIDRAWYGLGLSLAKLGRLDEAADKFEEAGRLRPMNPYAGYQLAGVRHRLGQPDKVRAQYERVKGFDPKVAERIRAEFGVQP
jgi:tetratricopeptide (TPR) repeat protein